MMANATFLVRRTVAFGILGALFLGLYAFVVEPIVAAYEQTNRSISQSQGTIVRYQLIGATLPRLEREYEQLRRRQLPLLGFLDGDKETLVAAEMQNKVKGVIEASGGELRSTQVLPARDEERFRRVTVRIHLFANEENLPRVLYALEWSRPYFFLDNVDVRSRPARTGRLRQAEEAGDLDVRFDVSGFMRGRSQ